MKVVRYIVVSLAVFLLVSCYKEYLVLPGSSEGPFDFTLTEEQEQELYNARGISYEVVDPIPYLKRGGSIFPLDRFEIRGESSLNFRRKSFSINMDTSFYIYIDREDTVRNIEEYKLISLVYDNTYIEGAIAIGMFHHLDLWPTHSEYTEVKLNGNTQGVYLLIEDPVEYFLYQRNASFILRRDYNHTLKTYHSNEKRWTEPDSKYIDRFNRIYSCILEYEGEVLYDSLMGLMDLPQYFRKLAVDTWLQNGDYTDEVFFYMKNTENGEVFGTYPWDYDDLFASVPHEIGRAWAVGTVFGTRSYGSVEDIIADVGEKLLFSIEDDLDYKIAIDDYLYKQYLNTLEEVVLEIDEEDINMIIAETKNQLQPFYDNDSIIAQSIYDVRETNQQLFDENLYNKKIFLLDRRNWIIEKLPEHKNSK